MKSEKYISKYVRPFFEDYLTCRRNVSGSTIHSYRDTIKLFFQFAANRIGKTPATLLIEKRRRNLIRTRNHRLALLQKFFEYISYQEPVWAESCRRVMEIPKKRGAVEPEICYLEKEEIQAVFDAIDTAVPIGRRDYALLLFMYNSGARAQETADLRLSWLSFDKPYRVEILGKGRKYRTCPLWESTANVLQRLISERVHPLGECDHIFLNRMGQPLSRFGILNIIKKHKYEAALRVPSLRRKKVTPHTIRHTTAMHLLQSGIEINVIRGWLGHAKLETTHRYAEIDLAMKRKALKSCEIRNRRSSNRWRSNPDILAWLESL